WMKATLVGPRDFVKTMEIEVVVVDISDDFVVAAYNWQNNCMLQQQQKHQEERIAQIEQEQHNTRRRQRRQRHQ
ncbi:365_t:CDS:2, partial [Ambispora leptoticha]